MGEIDDILIWAYESLNESQPSSTEDITCDPEFRTLFLDLVHSKYSNLPEAQILRRLSYLRKRSRLPRLLRSSK
jgi:hypothetical protein